MSIQNIMEVEMCEEENNFIFEIQLSLIFWIVG